MGTPVVYPQFKLRQHNGNPVDLDTDSIKIMVVTNSYVYDAAHDFINDCNAYEVSGSNYTAGGNAIAGVTLALDGDVLEWAHNDITISQHASGFTNGRTRIWYKDTGNPATSPVIMRMTESSDFGNQAGDVILDGSAATGVLQVS